jgi:hypothetical protein
MGVTHYSHYKFVTVSLLKRLRNDRFTSESNRHLDPEVTENTRWAAGASTFRKLWMFHGFSRRRRWA